MWIHYAFGISFLLLSAKLSSAQYPGGEQAQLNVSYGPDPEQILDIYIPEGPNVTFSKVILYIHGGSWSGGSKEDMDQFMPFLKAAFPDSPLVNMNYRLGKSSSPGYPKQVEDIEAALTFIKTKFGSEHGAAAVNFTLLGGSAGAHLSMLYAYGYDTERAVRVVVNIVGPADFTDPLYALNPIYNTLLFPFVGPYFFIQRPKLYRETSPVSRITAQSPPTISFYGLTDILVPTTQGPILRRYLNRAKVPNELSIYPGGHYFDWSDANKELMQTKVVDFMNKYF